MRITTIEVVSEVGTEATIEVTTEVATEAGLEVATEELTAIIITEAVFEEVEDETMTSNGLTTSTT